MPVRVRRSGAWHECQAWRAACGVSGRRMGRSAAPYGLFRAAIRCVPWPSPAGPMPLGASAAVGPRRAAA